MSNARSPRDVCSTTIGTRGLIGARPDLASEALGALASRSARRARPDPSRASRASRAPRPARRDRLRALDHRSTALRIAMSSRSASSAPCARARLSARLQLLVARRRGRAPRRASASLDLLVGDLDALGLDDRGEHRLALQRASRPPARPRRRAPPRSCRSSGGTARGSMPCGWSRRAVRCHISCAFAWTSSLRHLDLRLRRRRRPRRPRGTRASIARSSASRDARLDLAAQLVERVEAARLDGEVVVELRQALLLDLLDLDRERGVLAGEVLGRVVVREGDLDRALVAGRGARRAAPRSPGSAGPSRAPRAGRGPRRPRTARRRREPT